MLWPIHPQYLLLKGIESHTFNYWLNSSTIIMYKLFMYDNVELNTVLTKKYNLFHLAKKCWKLINCFLWGVSNASSVATISCANGRSKLWTDVFQSLTLWTLKKNRSSVSPPWVYSQKITKIYFLIVCSGNDKLLSWLVSWWQAMVDDRVIMKKTN